MRVRWIRIDDSPNAVVQVDEGKGWVSYKQSIHYSKCTDSVGFSPGYKLFCYVIKLGYKIHQLRRKTDGD